MFMFGKSALSPSCQFLISLLFGGNPETKFCGCEAVEM